MLVYSLILFLLVWLLLVRLIILDPARFRSRTSQKWERTMSQFSETRGHPIPFPDPHSEATLIPIENVQNLDSLVHIL